jgi:hypothetical protein
MGSMQSATDIVGCAQDDLFLFLTADAFENMVESLGVPILGIIARIYTSEL